LQFARRDRDGILSCTALDGRHVNEQVLVNIRVSEEIERHDQANAARVGNDSTDRPCTDVHATRSDGLPPAREAAARKLARRPRDAS
jgi:hypothetical protein